MKDANRNQAALLHSAGPKVPATEVRRPRAYHRDLDAVAAERASLQQAIGEGLEYGRFQLLYQPVVAPPDARIAGVEALPFIEVGRWVLRAACEQAADWHRRLGAQAPAKVNVNVSARHWTTRACSRTLPPS